MSCSGLPDPAAIRAQIERVLSGPLFVNSRRLSRFLTFISEAQLDGRGDQIKERVIGVEVFERGAGFDPAVDNIVRIEAGRLRHKLREYYEVQGKDDPIRIDVPKGSYAPLFSAQRVNEPPTKPPAPPVCAGPGSRGLARAFAAAISVVLMAGAIAPFAPVRTRQPDAQAVALYQKGRALWDQRSVKDSITVFKQAIDRDPGYADAWIGLADAYAVLVGNDYPDSGVYLHLGIAAANRAIQLNPIAGRPHAAMASFRRFSLQFAEAERENRLAIHLSPDDAVAHQWLGHLLMYEHRYHEALAELNQALRLDASQPMIWVNIGEVYYWMGNSAKALDWYEKTLKRFPDALAAAIGIEGIEIERHQYAIALEDVNRRLQAHPDDAGLNNHRRICLEMLHRSTGSSSN